MDANQFCATLALVPIVMASFVFAPLFGLKFKKHSLWLILLYSTISTIMAGVAILAGAFALVVVGVACMTSGVGGDKGAALFFAVTYSASFIILTLANTSILTSFGIRFPNCFEYSSKRSIALASATVVLLQVAVCVVPAFINSWFLSGLIPAALHLNDKPTDLNSLQPDQMTPERAREVEQQRKSDERLFKKD